MNNALTHRPSNILFILTDHFRPDAIGASTPRLQQLAKKGTIFSRAYCASPLCQPARNAIVTGLYPAQTGVCGNMNPPLRPEHRDDTFMHHLQRAGYRTAMIGKHHFTCHWGEGVDLVAEEAEIARYGLDHIETVQIETGWLKPEQDNPCHHTRFLREQGGDDLVEEFNRGARLLAKDCKPFHLDDKFFDDIFISDRSQTFIREHDFAQPLYLNVSFIGPHPPYWHPGELRHDPSAMAAPLAAPDSPLTRERRAHYMDRCALIDREIGKILDLLSERGELDQTLVVFSSDHGDNLGDFGIWDKRSFHEQSAGVPLIMAGPSVPRGARNLGGKHSRCLVSHLDLYTTFLTFAGLGGSPALARRPGRDIMAMLRDEPRAKREAVFAQLGTACMIRTANWKMVFDPEQGGVLHLYNLVRDPKEIENLAGVAGYEHIQCELTSRLLAQHIRLVQFTHDKEEYRSQTVRIDGEV